MVVDWAAVTASLMAALWVECLAEPMAVPKDGWLAAQMAEWTETRMAEWSVVLKAAWKEMMWAD